MRRTAAAVLGSLTMLVSGASGADAAPSSTIAYEASGHGEQVWVVGSNGNGRQDLGAGEQPLISPNGRMVAASNLGSRGHALVLYSTVGRPKQVYINLAQTAAAALAWSPDSRYLAVQLIDTTASSTATSPGAGGVAIVDTTTRTVKRIAAGFVFGASFKPAVNPTDLLAYGLSGSQKLNSRTDIFTINADGTGGTQITHSGRALNPVWGPRAIAFDQQRFRGNNAPDYDIWLMSATGTHRRRVTHVRAGPLVQGLVPLAFSASGKRMVAEFEGEDTSEGYTVSVPSGRAKLITAAHHISINANGISRTGNTVLVTLDAGENPTAEGRVAMIPFSGGPPKVVARHAGFGTWNG